MPPTAPAEATERRSTLLLLFLGGIVLTLAHRLSADEGQILTGAWNLHNGSRIYRDFFEFIGPASFSWVNLFFRVLGASYAAALVASQVLLLLGIWAFHVCARMVIGARTPRIAVSALWILLATTPPFINHNTYSTYVATVVACCLLGLLGADAGAETAPPIPAAWLAAAAGVLTGVTFYFLQPKGAALFAVVLATLVWVGVASGSSGDGRRVRFSLPAYLAGCALVVAAGTWRWGLSPVTSVLAVARGNLAMNREALPTSYLPLSAALALAVLAAVACHREGLLNRRIAFLLLLQGGLWASVAHLPDTWHVAVNAFPLLLVLGRLAEHSLSRARSKRWLRAMAVLFVLVVGLGTARSLARNVENTRTTRAWVTELRGILGGQEFFAFTFLPSFYLELRVPDPYYNSVLYVGSHPEGHFERNVAILEERRPRYVLADYSTVAKYGHTLDNPVDAYVRRRYRRIRELPHASGVLEVWERQ